MIAKAFEEIRQTDLQDLISNAVAERRTIEYKQTLPAGTDADKKEFLADVSSFANTAGGDLIFGMSESHGVPVQIVGITAADLDLEIRRLDSIIGAGLQPRVRHNIRVVETQIGLKVLLIRIERSWIGPHRVIFGGHDKFYARNSAGKYPLDVNELRSAFTFTEAIAERIRAFRMDRIIAVSNGQTPLPMQPSPKTVLHCLPLESFAGQHQFDAMYFYRKPDQLPPMGTTGCDRRINLDGVVTFNQNQSGQSWSYTQVYRNGVIEAVEGATLDHQSGGVRLIPSLSYQKMILEYLPICFRALQFLGSTVPIFVALTLTGVKGLVMGVSQERWGRDRTYPIDTETLVLPETEVEDFNTTPGEILKRIFDLVWNACGYPESKNFDSNGNWTGLSSGHAASEYHQSATLSARQLRRTPPRWRSAQCTSNTSQLQSSSR
jgi:hypothetical protein